MIISDVHVDLALDRAQEYARLQAAYALGGDATRKSVKDLIGLVEEYTGRKINVVEIDIQADSSSIRGFMVAYPDRYDICLLSEKNFCWKRFVMCKEIFHVILDADEFRYFEIERQIDEAAAAFDDNYSNPKANVASEAMAEIATLEFMFPYRDRVAILEAAKKDPAIADSSALAERYKIPRYWVERMLNPYNMEFFKHHFERRAKERPELAQKK